MRLLLWNGGPAGDARFDRLQTQLTDGATARGWTVHTEQLADVPVAWCQGCFECWTHSPGRCKIDDAGRRLADDYVAADALLLLTPSRFGAFSFETKKAVDRLLGTLLPFFQRIEGEVHHFHRYAHRPRLGVFGVVPSAEPAIEGVLRALAARSALNSAAPHLAVTTIGPRTAIADEQAAVERLLNDLLTETPLRPEVPIGDAVDAMLPALPVDAPGRDVERVVLLIGSAKPAGHSSSEQLAAPLVAGLTVRGVTVETHYVQRDAHSPAGLARLVTAVAAADLLLVATPLYFDSLPALVLAALEAILTAREAAPARPSLAVAGLLNSGFPEAHHSSVAVAQLALFTRAAGARWAGALQLGGGGVINGQPLAQAGHVVQHLLPALEKTAGALAHGDAIPITARETFRQPLMPVPLYMAAGDAGWLWTAAHAGALTRLWAKPGEQ